MEKILRLGYVPMILSPDNHFRDLGTTKKLVKTMKLDTELCSPEIRRMALSFPLGINLVEYIFLQIELIPCGVPRSNSIR